jgi:flagellar hook assembly protein FlgD
VFALSGSADVSVTVLNVAGRPVRTIAADKPLEAGLQTLVWDCKADGGLRVPAGLYLVRLTARAADGAQSTALATVSLR